MRNKPVVRDERTTAVENASYRWGYLFLSFGLLAVVMYRSFVRQEASWDLLALVVISGFVTTVYQALRAVIFKHRALTILGTVILAGLVAIAVELLHV